MQSAIARRQLSDSEAQTYRHVGAYLAAVRENNNLTLSEVAGRIHIKENILIAIEEMLVDDLPARPYAIGFVKSYADFLGVESGPVVESFKEDAGYSAPPEVEVEKFEAADTANEPESRDMSLWAVAAILGFVIWCAWQLTLPHEVTRLGNRDTTTIAAPEPELPFADPALQPPLAEVIPPVLEEKVEPIYPRRCTQGAGPVEMIVVSFNITIAGRISGERVTQSSNTCFDDAALNAVKRWQYTPQQVDGVPRQVYDQKYSFSFTRPQ